MDFASLIRAVIREEQLPIHQLLMHQAQQLTQQSHQQEAFRREVADKFEQTRLGHDARFDDLASQIATMAQASSSSATTASSLPSSEVSRSSFDGSSPEHHDIWVLNGAPAWAPPMVALSQLQPGSCPSSAEVQTQTLPGLSGERHAESGDVPALAGTTAAGAAAPAQPSVLDGIGKVPNNPLQCMLCGKEYKRKRCETLFSTLYSLLSSLCSHLLCCAVELLIV
jgi:hypothetical protein